MSDTPIKNTYIENNKITISRSILENYKDTTARFIFKLKDNTTFGIDAYYFSHERYTLEMFNNEEVIRINSIEDYFKYFNADPSRTYDSSKTDNYSKTFVLNLFTSSNQSKRFLETELFIKAKKYYTGKEI